VTRLPVVDERARAEAVAVTSHARGHDFEIQLGHLCNNRCVFCSSGELTRQGAARHIALEPILEAIQEAHASGARRLTFLGGEPTIHRGFIPALERSVELGFDQIVIFTDGVMFPRPGFIDRIVRLGGNLEWRISIQGGNEQAHVQTTGRLDSFRRILVGLERLQALGQRVTANVCVTSSNYRSLPDYPALVSRWGIRQLHLDMVRPSSAGPRSDDYLREIMPRYSDLAPFLRQMLERFERTDAGIDVHVGNLPFCILPEWSHRIEHGGSKTVTRAADESGLELPIDKYEWHASLRRYAEACDRCVFRRRCTGVFEEYLRLHGTDELTPVSPSDFRRAGGANQRFSLLAAAELEPILAESHRAPPPWSALQAHEDDREQWLELRFETARGRARLLLRPPERVRRPILSGRRYAIALEIEGLVATRELVALLQWFQSLLERVPDGWTPLDGRVVAATLRAARRRQRAEERAQQGLE
jgi:MoaA/NifB/PqqE/SkfB family radical SAM enzyme